MSKKSTMGCIPPLAILYLATNLQKHGEEVAVFDCDGYAGGLPEMAERIVDYRPNVVGLPIFSATPSFRDVAFTVRHIRQKLPDARIVIGGPHATAWPEKTLEWYPEADFVLAGEADETLVELVSQLRSNAASPSVPGLCYRDNGGVRSIPRGKPVTDLDKVPIPDRKLLWENYKRRVYWRIDRNGITDYMITGRGCPFRCRFCFQMDRGPYRSRSPENVLEEMVYLASLGIRNIDFQDDLFTVDKARCVRICRMIGEAGLRFDLKIRSRVNTIDADLLAELKKAGVRAVVFGIESGSQEVLDAMNKKSTVERNQEAIRLVKKAGLRCYADLFIGFPGETPDTLAKTERFLKKTKPTAINMSVLTPFPCTEVYDEAKRDGTLVGDWTRNGRKPFVKLSWADSPSVLGTCLRGITRRYYSQPAVLLGLLRDTPSPLQAQTWAAGFRFGRTLMGF